MTNQSEWQRPAAVTLSRTCPAAGSGTSTSTTSGPPPTVRYCTARIPIAPLVADPSGDRLSAVEMLAAPDGTALAVRRTGSGTPVVLVHGSAGGLDSWDPVLPFLDGFQC